MRDCVLDLGGMEWCEGLSVTGGTFDMALVVTAKLIMLHGYMLHGYILLHVIHTLGYDMAWVNECIR